METGHVADAILAGEHDARTANADAARRFRALVQRHDGIFVEPLMLTTSHVFQPFALLDRLTALRVAVRDLLPVDPALEDSDRDADLSTKTALAELQMGPRG